MSSEGIYRSSLTVDVVRVIGERERRLYERNGVSIRVGSIAHDERTLLCNVFQQRKAPLIKPLGTVEMVVMAEHVLAPLLAAGFNPMITANDWANSEDLRNSTDRPDELDPIGLISALRENGLPFPRLNTTAKEDQAPIIPLPFWRRALSAFAIW